MATIDNIQNYFDRIPLHHLLEKNNGTISFRGISDESNIYFDINEFNSAILEIIDSPKISFTDLEITIENKTLYLYHSKLEKVFKKISPISFVRKAS